MFAADRQCKPRLRIAPSVRPELEQLAHAFSIQRVKRVFFKDTLLDIVGHESTCIVPRQAVGHLRKVVCAETQEFAVDRDFSRAKRRANEHPLPGPTPVTTHTGLAMECSSPDILTRIGPGSRSRAARPGRPGRQPESSLTARQAWSMAVSR